MASNTPKRGLPGRFLGSSWNAETLVAAEGTRRAI